MAIRPLCFAMEPTGHLMEEKRQQAILRLFQSANQKKDTALVKRLLNTIPYEELQAVWRELLYMSYDSNNIDFIKELTRYAISKEPALHAAAGEGSLEKMSQLLTKENVNSKNLNGQTALFITTENQNVAASRLLLEAGANPCIEDLLGMTPLHETVDNPYTSNYFALLKLFVEHGAASCINHKKRTGETPLQSALLNSNTTAALYLLDNGANPNSKDRYGLTPLHNLSLLYKGTPDQTIKLAQKLIDKGADINAQDNEGITPLYLAALKLPKLNPKPYLVYFLLTHKADAQLKDTSGVSSSDLIQATWSVTPEQFLILQREKPFEQELREKSFAPEPIKIPKKIEPKPKKPKKHKPKLTYGQVQEKKALAEKQLPKGEEAVTTPPSKEPVSKQAAAVAIPAQPKIPLVLAERVKNWWSDNWLAQEKQIAKSAGAYEYWKFLRSRLYHRLPETALQTIVDYGKPEPRPNKTYPGQIDTVYTLEGEMQFEHFDNPWNPGRQRQPGFYHVTRGIDNKIYHIGFNPIQQRGFKLAEFMPEQQIPVEWVTKKTPDYFAVYDPNEAVRHVLFLK